MYKELIAVVTELGGCNEFEIKPFNEWPDLAPAFDIDQLNAQAATLTEEELTTFIDGEEQEVDALTDTKQLAELNDFLNEVFGGSLHHLITIL